MEVDLQSCPMMILWSPPVNNLRSAEKIREIQQPAQLTSGANHKTNQSPRTSFDYPAAPLGSQYAGCLKFEFGGLAVG